MLALVSIRTAIRRPLGVAEVQAGRLAEERPGERHRQQGQGRGPQQEQEPVVQAAPARQPGRRRGEEHQRAERHLAPGGAADQVEDDRGRDRQRAQDVERREEAHRAPPRPRRARRRPGPPARRIRAFRRSKSTSSSGRVGGDRLEVDPQVGAGPLDLGGVRGEPLEVSGAGGGRVDVQLAARSPRRWNMAGAANVNADLGRVEDAEDDHLVAAGAEVAEPGAERVGGGEQVGDQDDQARACATVAAICSSGPARSVARPARLAVEHRHQAAEVAGAVARGQVVGDPVLEREQADRVALERRGSRRSWPPRSGRSRSWCTSPEP